ncbi:hypothetical protein THAOC_10722, partial [Thalassiosira oceanica]
MALSSLRDLGKKVRYEIGGHYGTAYNWRRWTFTGTATMALSSLRDLGKKGESSGQREEPAQHCRPRSAVCTALLDYDFGDTAVGALVQLGSESHLKGSTDKPTSPGQTVLTRQSQMIIQNTILISSNAESDHGRAATDRTCPAAPKAPPVVIPAGASPRPDEAAPSSPPGTLQGGRGSRPPRVRPGRGRERADDTVHRRDDGRRVRCEEGAGWTEQLSLASAVLRCTMKVAEGCIPEQNRPPIPILASAETVDPAITEDFGLERQRSVRGDITGFEIRRFSNGDLHAADSQVNYKYVQMDVGTLTDRHSHEQHGHEHGHGHGDHDKEGVNDEGAESERGSGKVSTRAVAQAETNPDPEDVPLTCPVPNQIVPGSTKASWTRSEPYSFNVDMVIQTDRVFIENQGGIEGAVRYINFL